VDRPVAAEADAEVAAGGMAGDSFECGPDPITTG
jgi:hypothetical protein